MNVNERSNLAARAAVKWTETAEWAERALRAAKAAAEWAEAGWGDKGYSLEAQFAIITWRFARTAVEAAEEAEVMYEAYEAAIATAIRRAKTDTIVEGEDNA